MKLIIIGLTILFTSGLPAAQERPPALPRVVPPELPRVPIEGTAIKGAPYSAEVVVESTQTLADGNRIVQRTASRVYRDGQGRVRREEDLGQTTSVSITDPEAGVSYSLNPESRIAWKTSKPAAEVIWLKVDAAREVEYRKVEEKRRLEAETNAKLAGPRVERRRSPSETRTEQLPARTIEGVQAVGRRTTTTIPAGAIGNDLPIVIVSEEWSSPDLQLLVMTSHSDPRIGESTYKLVNIVRAEPDRSLFMVPSDYTIRETGIRRPEPRRE